MKSRHLLTPWSLVGAVSRRLATVAFLAVLLVGCATKAPLRHTDPESPTQPSTNSVSPPTSSVDREVGQDPGETYETVPIEESGNTVQGPPDSAAAVPPDSSWRPQLEIDGRSDLRVVWERGPVGQQDRGMDLDRPDRRQVLSSEAGVVRCVPRTAEHDVAARVRTFERDLTLDEHADT